MDSFKIEYFKNSNPGEGFLQYRSLSAAECEDLRRSLAKQLGLKGTEDTLLLLSRLHERPSMDMGVLQETEPVDILETVRSGGLKCGETVYVNWYRFDDVDEISANDLSRCFHYIWYPSSDDIEIFDKSGSWVLAVDHGGHVRLIGLGEDGGGSRD